MADDTSQSAASAEQPCRRTFLQRFLAWSTGLIGAVAALAVAVPFVGYLLGPRRRKDLPWVDLGLITEERFPKGQTRLSEPFRNPLGQAWDGITALTNVFVRYLGKDEASRDQFLVFAVNCAHLGCPVQWFPQSGLFMCPCHGGVYYENGERASGPPPRGLFQCVWRVREEHLEIQAPHYPTLHNTLKDGA